MGIRATPIAEAMLALVLIDHALRHRAQNADVVCPTPKIAGTRSWDEVPASGDNLKLGDAVEDTDPDEP